MISGVSRGIAAEYFVSAHAYLRGMRALRNPDQADTWDLILTDTSGQLPRRVQVKLAYRRAGYKYLTVDIIKSTGWEKYGPDDAELLAVVTPEFDRVYIFEWKDVYATGRKSLNKVLQTVPFIMWEAPNVVAKD